MKFDFRRLFARSSSCPASYRIPSMDDLYGKGVNAWHISGTKHRQNRDEIETLQEPRVKFRQFNSCQSVAADRICKRQKHRYVIVHKWQASSRTATFRLHLAAAVSHHPSYPWCRALRDIIFGYLDLDVEPIGQIKECLHDHKPPSLED
jgi:hypothetical protein